MFTSFRRISSLNPKKFVNAACSQPRWLSFRSFPQYSVHGENCVLAVKIILPSYKVLKNNILAVENKGRMLLEWTPRTIDGDYVRDMQVRFALSPEEVGLLLDQLPQFEVEFTRRNPISSEGASDDTTEKVFRVKPASGGVFHFLVDFEKDGVGGMQGNGRGASGPLEVQVQMGEYQVIREILRSALPTLTGWQSMLNFAVENQLANIAKFGGWKGGDDGRDNDVPF